MIEMLIGQQAYTIPEDLTIEQWMKVNRWDLQQAQNWPHILEALTGHPRHELEMGKQEALQLGALLVSDLLNKRSQSPIIDFNTLTFGQWVDIEVWLAFGHTKHLSDIVGILSPLEDPTASQALWVLDRYLEYRTYILRQYEGLFDGDSEADDEPVAKDPMQAAKSWFKIIVDLAGNDILKVDAVTDQPLKKALNFLALKKEEHLAELLRQRQQRQNELHIQRHR